MCIPKSAALISKERMLFFFKPKRNERLGIPQEKRGNLSVSLNVRDPRRTRREGDGEYVHAEIEVRVCGDEQSVARNATLGRGEKRR